MVNGEGNGPVVDPVALDGLPIDFGVDPDAPFHRFLLQSEHATNDPVTVVARLQDHVADLPDHKETFRVTEVLDSEWPSIKDTRMVELTGAWPVPDHLQSNQYNRYVNPSSPSASYYAGVAARCDCGALMVRKEDYTDDHGQVTQGEHEHTDDCPKDYRLRARADLGKKRREVIKRVCYLGHSVRSAQDRIGIARDSLGQEARDLGVEITALREEGRKRIARTAVRLLVDRSPTEIGEAYDCHAQKIRRLVNQHTDADASELYEYRTQHKTDRLSRRRQEHEA